MTCFNKVIQYVLRITNLVVAMITIFVQPQSRSFCIKWSVSAFFTSPLFKKKYQLKNFKSQLQQSWYWFSFPTFINRPSRREAFKWGRLLTNRGPDRSGSCLILIRQPPYQSGCSLILIWQVPDWSGSRLISGSLISGSAWFWNLHCSCS